MALRITPKGINIYCLINTRFNRVGICQGSARCNACQQLASGHSVVQGDLWQPDWRVIGSYVNNVNIVVQQHLTFSIHIHLPSACHDVARA